MPVPENPLKQYQWKNRILLIFSPTLDNDKLLTQQKLFAPEKAAWDERSVKLFTVTQHDWKQSPFSQNEQKRLRGQFKIDDDAFSIILIGKDGGEKFRSSTVVASSKIINMIDSMPMRRQEMKK